MANDQHEIRRMLRILQHAEKIGFVSKTCRYFGVGRVTEDSRHRGRFEIEKIGRRAAPLAHVDIDVT